MVRRQGSAQIPAPAERSVDTSKTLKRHRRHIGSIVRVCYTARRGTWMRRWFIFAPASCDSLSIIRFRSEDRVSYSTDAAAMDSLRCLTTFQRGRCVLSEGLETRPSACRMISLLTSADSKASLIQQRQQRIFPCASAWCGTRVSCVLSKFQVRLV